MLMEKSETKICPYCGESLKNTEEKCLYCGEILPRESMQIPQNNRKIFFIIGIILLFICSFGIIYEVYTTKNAIIKHEDENPQNSNVEANIVLNLINVQDKNLRNFMSAFHLSSDKDKVFLVYLDNLNYYLDIINRQKILKNDDDSFEDLGIASMYGDFAKGGICIYENVKFFSLTGPHDETGFGEIKEVKIINPKTPAVKMLPSNYEEAEYIVVPNFEYLEKEYASYLSKSLKDYLIIQKQIQKELGKNNSYFEVKRSYVAEWIIEWQNFEKKYPNFKFNNEINRDIKLLVSILVWKDSRKDYELFLQKGDKTTEIYTAVKKCYEILSKHKFEYCEEFEATAYDVLGE